MDSIHIEVFKGEEFTQVIDCDASANASGYTLPSTLSLRVRPLASLSAGLMVEVGDTVVDKTVTTISTTAGTFPFALTDTESDMLAIGVVYGWQAATDDPFVVAQGTVVSLSRYATIPAP